MSPEVAVTSWAVWSAAGVSVNEAPIPGGGNALALWPDRPAPIVPARGRPVPPSASALVQLVQAVLTTRHARAVPPPPTTVDLRLGTRTGSREIDLAFLQSLAERGDAFGSPSLFAYTLSTAAGGEVSLALGLRGALSTMSSGEVSGLAALVRGAASVTSGRIGSLPLWRNGRVGRCVGRDRLVSARACPTLPPHTPTGRLEALLRSGGSDRGRIRFDALDDGTSGRSARPWRERGDRSLLSRRPFGLSHRRSSDCPAGAVC